MSNKKNAWLIWVKYFCCICYSHQLKGSQQKDALVRFSLFPEKREKHIFGNSQNMLIFLAKMNKISLKIVNSGDFAMILLLKMRKN